MTNTNNITGKEVFAMFHILYVCVFIDNKFTIYCIALKMIMIIYSSVI